MKTIMPCSLVTATRAHPSWLEGCSKQESFCCVRQLCLPHTASCEYFTCSVQYLQAAALCRNWKLRTWTVSCWSLLQCQLQGSQPEPSLLLLQVSGILQYLPSLLALLPGQSRRHQRSWNWRHWRQRWLRKAVQAFECAEYRLYSKTVCISLVPKFMCRCPEFAAACNLCSSNKLTSQVYHITLKAPDNVPYTP